MVRGSAGYAALLSVALLAMAGCAGHSAETSTRPAVAPNFLAGCGPLDDAVLAAHLRASALRPQTAPTMCTWTAEVPGAGTVDLTYAWLRDDTLARDVQVAQRQGYRIDRVVVKRFGGMYWRDPRDPGSCAVTVADTGTLTWWVQDRDHGVGPEPCSAAMDLIQAALAVDGV